MTYLLLLIIPLLAALYLADFLPSVRARVIPKYVKYGKRPYRSLEKWESQYLRDFININKDIMKHTYYIQGICLGVLFVIPIILLVHFNINLEVIVIIVIGFAVAWSYYMTIRRSIQKDLSAPVFIEIGNFYRDIVDGSQDSLFTYMFGRKSASMLSTNPLYHETVKKIKNGEIVAVEYSPRSSFVWSITPVDRKLEIVEEQEIGCYIYCNKQAVIHVGRRLEGWEKQILMKTKGEDAIWDLENNVYCAIGEASVEKNKQYYSLRIAGIKFDVNNIQQEEIKTMIQELKKCEIYMEYSAFTGFIWNINVIKTTEKQGGFLDKEIHFFGK